MTFLPVIAFDFEVLLLLVVFPFTWFNVFADTWYWPFRSSFHFFFFLPSSPGWVPLELEMFLTTHVKFLILFLRNASVFECDQWSDAALTLSVVLSSFESFVPLSLTWLGQENVFLRNKVVHFQFSCSCFLSFCPTCMFACLNMQFFSCLICSAKSFEASHPAAWALATTEYLSLCWLFPCCIEGSLGGEFWSFYSGFVKSNLFELLRWIIGECTTWAPNRCSLSGCSASAAYANAVGQTEWNTLRFQEAEMMQILKPSGLLLWSCFWVSAVCRLKYLSLICILFYISGSKEISRNPKIVPKGFGSLLRQRGCLSLHKSSYNSCRKPEW